MSTPWTISGAGGEPILGDAHHPAGPPRGVIVIAHGFKGYKDYGMFPFLARAFAERGLVAHRFNFSHSGMTSDTATFARPDLFERDTWSRQVEDLRAVMAAIEDGALDGGGLPRVLFGHSRGGAATLLTAGRHHPALAGVITAAAPAACSRLTAAETERMRADGFLLSPSSRTGQALRVGRAWLAEQEADPAGHDLLALAARIDCPVLVAHGDADPTVPVDDARALVDAIGASARLHVVAGADHVFGAPNPMPADVAPSAQLADLLAAAAAFIDEVLARG